MFFAVAASLYEDWAMVEKDVAKGRNTLRSKIDAMSGDFSRQPNLGGTIVEGAELPGGVTELPVG